LTEDEKKAKLEELRERLQAKRAVQSIKDKEDQKRNEVSYFGDSHPELKSNVLQQIRQKSTKESQEAKEELAKKQAVKEAAAKRQEKLEDQEAKRRIKAKIEADKAERRRKAEEAKAAREGRTPQAEAAAPGGAAAVAAAAKPKSNHNEARLRLQTNGGNITKTLPAETTLFELAQQVQSETGNAVSSFTTTFPRKTFEGDVDFSKTLKEAGLVPSSVLIVK
jgi:hypothetical protein